MFSFDLKPRFARKYAKLVKNDRTLESVLELLAEDPRDLRLRSHKVSAWDGRVAFSSSVTGDLRVIWRYAEAEVEVIDLVDIGGHEGSKKVYH